MFIDCHSHWTDERIASDQIPILLQQCLSQQITLFMQAGVDPDGWKRQIELQKGYPENFVLSLGLHPYFVAKNNIEDCERALDQLAKILPHAIGIGETGLDFRPSILAQSSNLFSESEIELAKGQQMTMFENQLALSKLSSKPLVLHVVRAHEEAIHILKTWGPPAVGGMVHAFNGSFETASQYIELGFYISIGGAVTYQKNTKLQAAVLKIPLDRLLIESDSPDQAPENWVGLNNSTSIWSVATEIARIKDISPVKVMQTSSVNFKRLFSL